MSELSAAVVLDALEQVIGAEAAARYWTRGIHSVHGNQVVIGPAHTVRLTAISDSFSAERRLEYFRAVDGAPAGAVWVSQVAGDVGGATLGDVVAQRLQYRGLVGAVVDGVVRDVTAIESLGFSAFAREISMAGGNPGRFVTEVGVRVAVGGVAVAPGDTVVADRDGVVVVPAAHAEETLALARFFVETEVESHERVAKGEPMETAYPPKGALAHKFRGQAEAGER